MSEKKNLLTYCNDQGMNPQDFMRMFCRRCRNYECVNAAFAGGLFDARVATQAERLLENPTFADPDDPKYADVRVIFFKDMIQEAMRLEVSDQRGDWTVPDMPDIPSFDVADGQDIVAPDSTTSSVDKAVKALARNSGKPEPNLPDPKEGKIAEFRKETQRLMEEEDIPIVPPPPPEPTKQPDVAPATMEGRIRPDAASIHASNIPMPPGGMMLDGEAVPARPKETPDHPVIASWGGPKKDRVVPIGAKIQMGGGGMAAQVKKSEETDDAED